MKALNADRILTRRWPYGSAALVYYVRPGGDDNNSGLSAADAFATLSRALHFMAIADVNVSVVIDVTGMTIDASEVLNLGGTTLGAINFDLDVGATAPNNFYSRRQRQIRSELVLSTPLTRAPTTRARSPPFFRPRSMSRCDASRPNAARSAIARR